MSKKEMEGKNPVKYEMRAPPRRRIKGEDSDDQPVFLRKAFIMMSSCPPEIGGWSEKGDTVIVRDVKQFAEKIIPTAYKHNNFSSFVRQLNFCKLSCIVQRNFESNGYVLLDGFRKIKSELIEQASWWEFRHPQFLRDQPQLLSEIKRSVHYVNETSNGHEVSDLKNQVGSLTDRIEALHEQIEMLSGAVSHMQLNCAAPDFNAVDNGKRRKVHVKHEHIPMDTDAGVYGSSDAYGGGAGLVRMSSLGSAMDLLDFPSSPPTGPELQNMLFGSGENTAFGAVDEEAWDRDIDQLLDMQQGLDSPAAHRAASAPASEKAQMNAKGNEQECLPRASAVAVNEVYAAPTPAAAVSDLFAVLEGLSPELKIRFVDKLAEVMGKQLTENMAAPTNAAAVPAPYVSPYATQHQQPQSAHTHHRRSQSDSISPSQSFAQLTTGSNAPYHLPSGAQAPEIALPLASAALGAFVLSSLNSLVMTQQQQAGMRIKTEVV
jgi:hypothetical protein